MDGGINKISDTRIDVDKIKTRIPVHLNNTCRIKKEEKADVRS